MHANDKKNRNKHERMARRLERGILKPHETNSGNPGTSKINPNCLWAKKKKLNQPHKKTSQAQG
ncbi:MAG: hypothetical protein OXE99_06055 [Cellvibrionales bacterium]|nr:hypothetical protein [Cellvibrionales bacterium]